jgi:hypothetical protein
LTADVLSRNVCLQAKFPYANCHYYTMDKVYGGIEKKILCMMDLVIQDDCRTGFYYFFAVYMQYVIQNESWQSRIVTGDILNSR